MRMFLFPHLLFCFCLKSDADIIVIINVFTKMHLVNDVYQSLLIFYNFNAVIEHSQNQGCIIIPV